MKTTKEFTKSEIDTLRNIITEKTGYTIKNNALLIQAFTKDSYSYENGGEDNEVLEFVGDRVVEYYLGKIVAEKCGKFTKNHEYDFSIGEDRFTKLEQHFVNNKTLGEIVESWGVLDYLVVGRGDKKNRFEPEEKVKGDLFEAILGAIAISSDWDPKVLENATRKMLSLDKKVDEILRKRIKVPNFDIDNAIDVLSMLNGKKVFDEPPFYEFGTPEALGYDDNNPVWLCRCFAGSIMRTVFAPSKHDAQKACAYLILCDYFGSENKYGKTAKTTMWNYKDKKLNPFSF